MSERTKKSFDIVNKILGILCAVTFIVAACRVANVFINHVDNVIKIENNQIKN